MTYPKFLVAKYALQASLKAVRLLRLRGNFLRQNFFLENKLFAKASDSFLQDVIGSTLYSNSKTIHYFIFRRFFKN